MNEQELTSAQELDPLSHAASGIEPPKFPVLMPERICQFRIVTSKVEDVKNDSSRKLLTLSLATERPYPDKEGKTLNKGFKVFHRIGLTPTPPTDTSRGRTIENVASDLGLLLRSCGMETKSPRQLVDNPTLIEGCIVDCKVGLNKEKDGYPESNRISFIPPKV